MIAFTSASLREVPPPKGSSCLRLPHPCPFFRPHPPPPPPDPTNSGFVPRVSLRSPLPKGFSCPLLSHLCFPPSTPPQTVAPAAAAVTHEREVGYWRSHSEQQAAAGPRPSPSLKPPRLGSGMGGGQGGQAPHPALYPPPPPQRAQPPSCPGPKRGWVLLMGLGTESSGETHPSGGAHWENTMGRGVQGGKCKWRAVGRRECFRGCSEQRLVRAR